MDLVYSPLFFEQKKMIRIKASKKEDLFSRSENDS